MRLIVNEHMDVIGATTENTTEILPREHRVTQALTKQGHPVIHCPTHGTVPVFRDGLDPKQGAWTAACPLCGHKIWVGKFAIVSFLAYHKRATLTPVSPLELKLNQL